MSGTAIERLTRMEVEVSELKKSFEEHKQDTKDNFSLMKADVSEINKKLDDVLALRNKGAGIFWFLSLIFGSAGVLGVLNLFHHIGIK